MSYDVFLHPKADKFLKKSDEELRNRIRDRLKELETKPEKEKRLSASDFLSLRVGDYRAIYEIDQGKEKVVVLFIGHRKNVYDDFLELV